IRLRDAIKEWHKHESRPRSQGDDPFLGAPSIFVARGAVVPDVTGAVDVAGAHDDDLARPHAGEPLKPDHCCDGRRQEWQDGLNTIVFDRSYWFPVRRRRTATL